MRSNIHMRKFCCWQTAGCQLDHSTQPARVFVVTNHENTHSCTKQLASKTWPTSRSAIMISHAKWKRSHDAQLRLRGSRHRHTPIVSYNHGSESKAPFICLQCLFGCMVNGGIFAKITQQLFNELKKKKHAHVILHPR